VIWKERQSTKKKGHPFSFVCRYCLFVVVITSRQNIQFFHKQDTLKTLMFVNWEAVICELLQESIDHFEFPLSIYSMVFPGVKVLLLLMMTIDCNRSDCETTFCFQFVGGHLLGFCLVCGLCLLDCWLCCRENLLGNVYM
jgi:hypothetical protein